MLHRYPVSIDYNVNTVGSITLPKQRDFEGAKLIRRQRRNVPRSSVASHFRIGCVQAAQTGTAAIFSTARAFSKGVLVIPTETT